MNSLLNKFRSLPIATFGIIAINLAVLMLSSHDKIMFQQCYVNAYGVVPGALRVGSLFASAFLHDGYIHLAMNMLFLYIFGSAVEHVMGRLEYVLFYIGACFVASLTYVAIVLGTLPPNFAFQPMVGASGAVAGVMGIYAVRFHRKMFRFAGAEFPALLLVMGWLLLQVGLGVLGLYRDSILGLGLKQVGYWSHLGGFGFGIVIALIGNMALAGEREYLVQQAEYQDSEGNLLEAIRNHETLLKYDPDNANSHVQIGRLWALLEEKEESLSFYQVGIELFISQGLEDQALDAAGQMQQFWPKSNLSSATRFRLASYLEETGQPQRAVKAFADIASHEPESAEAQMSVLKIGQLQLISLSDPASATTTLTGFLKTYPKSEWRRFAEETLARARTSLCDPSIVV